MREDGNPRLFQLPRTSKFRVSVCRLEDDAWREQGLGLVSCERRDKDGQTWLTVENERKPTETLVRCPIKAPLSFRKQESLLFCAAPLTSITINSDVSPRSTGRDPDGADTASIVRVALCFQELAGCATICDFLIQAAHSWAPGVTVTVQYASADSSGEVDLEVVVQQPPLPPLPTRENALSAASIMSQALSTPLGREFLAVYLDQTHYLDHMYELFEEMEHASDITAAQRIRTLWALADIMKQYFHVGDSYLIDKVVQSDHYVKVIGILEYDRAFGHRKANFRDYYCNHTELKQVIEINDTPVLEKIRRTFRLQLIRDILVRSADEFSYQILRTLIYVNQVDIIDRLQNSTNFCDDLFGLFDEGDETLDAIADESAGKTSPKRTELRRQGLRFINEVIKTSKTFTMHQMRVLYENLTDYGLFEVLNYAMDDDETLEPKILALESLSVLMDFDPQLAARHFVPIIESLTLIICDTKSLSANLNPAIVGSMQIQACELLKKLMAEEPKLTVDTFFKQVARHLSTTTATTNALGLQHILDIISFAYARAPAKTLQLIIELGFWPRLAATPPVTGSGSGDGPNNGFFVALSRALQHALQANVINERDRLVTQSEQLIENNLIGMVLELLSGLGNTNHMVHSSCLSLLELIAEGSRNGEPQFRVIAHWISHEKMHGIIELGKSLPTISAILALAEDDSSSGALLAERNREKADAVPSSSNQQQQQQQQQQQHSANRKRPTSSDVSHVPKAQRPRVRLSVSLQQAQAGPVDEIDSQDIASTPALESTHSDEEITSQFLDGGSTTTNDSDQSGSGDLTQEYFGNVSTPSPTSPTAENASYWKQSLAALGAGATGRRAMLLPGSRTGASDEKDAA